VPKKKVDPYSDPFEGRFTLEQATEGLSGEGPLRADIVTDLGTLECELHADKAPLTVANFVGLARGLRPFQDPTTNRWIKRPAYDRTEFHRVSKGFMIQGGDPTGTGEVGYRFPDEMWPGAKHDQVGLLCMANSGPNTNGAQFFILDGPAPFLTERNTHTIFGKCGPDELIHKIAKLRTRDEKPLVPPTIKTVTIRRGT
jgi:peptidyl-prolyl cis-trans isomerase A (cyclophilin A)